MTQLNKVVLRKKILKQRQELSPTQWQNQSHLICNRLQTLALFKKATTVFAYFSYRQEADLSSLFSFNKNWAFPRCVGKSLVWHLWRTGDTLIKDKYGIQTPLDTAPIIASSSADLILVPTVACDRRKYRLGYGGGFYDRLLSSPSVSKISTIGIVFDFAYIEELPIDPWDIKLDFICTPSKFSNGAIVS